MAGGYSRVGDDRCHPCRVLDLRVMAELGQLGDGHAGAKLAERREDGGRRDRVLQAPGEPEPLPVADRAVPARRQLDPLVEVVDRAGGRASGRRRGRSAPTGPSASAGSSGWPAEKRAPNWWSKKRRLLSRAASGPSGPRSSFWARVRLAASRTMLPLNRSDAGELPAEACPRGRGPSARSPPRCPCRGRSRNTGRPSPWRRTSSVVRSACQPRP